MQEKFWEPLIQTVKYLTGKFNTTLKSAQLKNPALNIDLNIAKCMR